MEELPEMENALKIFGQGAWHSPAFIVGDKPTLLRLRDAINVAVEQGQAAIGAMPPDDGEGYTVFVICRTADEIAELRSAYEFETAKGEGLAPEELIADVYDALSKAACKATWG